MDNLATSKPRRSQSNILLLSFCIIVSACYILISATFVSFGYCYNTCENTNLVGGVFYSVQEATGLDKVIVIVLAGAPLVLTFFLLASLISYLKLGQIKPTLKRLVYYPLGLIVTVSIIVTLFLFIVRISQTLTSKSFSIVGGEFLGLLLITLPALAVLIPYIFVAEVNFETKKRSVAANKMLYILVFIAIFCILAGAMLMTAL